MKQLRRGLASFCLVANLCAPVQAMPPGSEEAAWEGEGLRFTVRHAKASDVPAEPLAAGALLLIGLVGTPVVAIVQPIALLGMPVFLIVAPAMQARFNAQSETLTRVFVDQGLAQDIVEAVRSRWVAAPGAAVTQAQLGIVGYGLVTASGRRLQALEPRELLCLVAEARLDWERDGAAPRTEPLSIGLNERSTDAPPPLCMGLDGWSEAEGLKLRQGLRELAAVLGAMAAARMAQQP
jgi:hypothetical protein